MVSRRAILVGIGAIGIGGGAYATNEDVKNRVNAVVSEASRGVGGPPPTETMISSAQGRSLVKRVEFYESGAAQIHPKADQGCYEAMAFRHEATSLGAAEGGRVDPSDGLATWEFGEFDEVVTVDMAGAISQKSNYPNRTFVLQMVSTDDTCISFTGETETKFQVPDSYMP